MQLYLATVTLDHISASICKKLHKLRCLSFYVSKSQTSYGKFLVLCRYISMLIGFQHSGYKAQCQRQGYDQVAWKRIPQNL